jgi:hypothetical protein
MRQIEVAVAGLAPLRDETAWEAAVRAAGK